MHWMLRLGVEREVNSLPWREERAGAHVVRATLFYLFNGLDTGPCCPMSINYAAVPTFRQDPALAAEWEDRLTLPDYDRFAQAGMVMTEKQGGSDLRANTHPGRPRRRRLVRAHRPQVVLHPPDLRRLPDPGAGARRDHLLRRHASRPRLPPAAAEGQARRPLPGLERGRVRPAARPHPRRGGPRHRVHDRADRLDPAGHAARHRGDRAPGRGRGHLARPPPLRLRRPAGAAAGHAQRARRPRARVRGHAGGGDADRARLRQRRPARGRLPPPGAGGHEVLGVQARRAHRGRGARVPGRQRVHRGGAAGPAVPRRPARHRLGGLGQRHRPRRAARDAPQPRGRAGAAGRARGRGRRRPALRRAPGGGQVFFATPDPVWRKT